MAHHRTSPRKASRSSSRHSAYQDENDGIPRSSFASVKGPVRAGHSLDLNESSPLLSPTRFQDDRVSEDHDTLTGTLDWNDGRDEEQSKSVFYLFILTLSIGG